MRVLTAVLALFASIPAVADDSIPMPWWRVAATPINHDKQDATPLAADCPICKKKDASGHGLKWCPECAKTRQACPSCGLRIAGEPPLKKVEEKK